MALKAKGAGAKLNDPKTPDKKGKKSDDVQVKEGEDKWGLPVADTGDPEKDKELKKLRSLVRQEQSHGIWAKQGFNFSSLAFLITISFLRG